jgi:hypothetical protein
MFASEELARAGDGQRLGDVHELAAAVVPPARIALGVLVREHRAHRAEHRRADEVLRGDQLEPRVLTLGFPADDVGNLGVHLGEAALRRGEQR